MGNGTVPHAEVNLLDTLVAIEKQRRDAWLSRNKADLALLLDEDFLEINYFGRLSKNEILENLFERLYLKEFILASPTLHGTSASPIISYSCFERLLVDGNEIQGDFSVASHFIRSNDQWKILLWQITPRMATEPGGAGQPDNHPGESSGDGKIG